MKQTYQIFGLKIQSDIELAAPLISAKDFDAEINFGQVVYPPESYVSKGACFYARLKEVFIEIKDVARFLIQDGRRIIVEIFPESDIEAVKLFLNGPVFGALLLQRNLLPIHSAAFEYKGKAVLLSGNSGIGKSSLLVYLVNNGYKLIADDVSALKIENGEVKLFSSGHNIKLWKDALEKLNLQQENLKKARLKLEKYYYPAASENSSWKVGQLYVLKSHNKPEIEISKIKGVERFNTIKDNTYRKVFIKGLGIEKEYMNLVMQASMKIPVTEIIRPNVGFHVEEMAKLLLNDLEKNS